VNDELVKAAEQLVVGDGTEREFGVHATNIGRGFRASQEDERLHQRASVVARGSSGDYAGRVARRCVTRGFARASLGVRRVASESCQGVAEKKLHAAWDLRTREERANVLNGLARGSAILLAKESASRASA
jgi:hypothetical protein